MGHTPASNIEVSKRAIDGVNARDIDACLSMMTPGFIINIAEMPFAKHGHHAWRQHAELLFAAFPDVVVSIVDTVAMNDTVAIRVRVTGTHNGEFIGNAPTGRKIDYTSHEFYRFENGKIAEEWICSDSMTLLTQIGALSRGRLAAMWLASYRSWVGFAAGLAVATAVSIVL